MCLDVDYWHYFLVVLVLKLGIGAVYSFVFILVNDFRWQ